MSKRRRKAARKPLAARGQGTIEGWPFDGPPESVGAQARYNKAAARLTRAEARMRRSFNAWEKARAAERRMAKALERDGAPGPHPPAGPDPELNDRLS